MEIKTGCDLVQLKKFQDSLERGPKGFLKKLFTDHELANNPSIESLAGLFAAKEAVKKALGLSAGDWHAVEVVKEKNGRPQVKLSVMDKNIISSDVSISHDGEYVMAVAVFLLEQS